MSISNPRTGSETGAGPLDGGLGGGDVVHDGDVGLGLEDGPQSGADDGARVSKPMPSSTMSSVTAVSLPVNVRSVRVALACWVVLPRAAWAMRSKATSTGVVRCAAWPTFSCASWRACSTRSRAQTGLT